MPAIAIVADVVISSVFAEAGISAAISAAVGGGLIGAAATGAVIGAVGGAVSAEVQGGNIWKGAEMGAIGGAVAGGVTQGLLGDAGTQGYTANVDPTTGEVSLQLTQATPASAGLLGTTGALPAGMTAEQAAALGLTPASLGQSALARGLGTSLGSLATGQKPLTAVEQGVIGGGLDYLFPSTGSTGDKISSGIEKGFASTALSQLLAPSSSARGLPSTGGVAVTGQPGQTGTAPGSQALAQALNVGDAGSPVLGGGDSTGRKNVWNVESLRYMGNPPSENTSG
jgi:hypothetical protein